MQVNVAEQNVCIQGIEAFAAISWNVCQCGVSIPAGRGKGWCDEPVAAGAVQRLPRAGCLVKDFGMRDTLAPGASGVNVIA